MKGKSRLLALLVLILLLSAVFYYKNANKENKMTKNKINSLVEMTKEDENKKTEKLEVPNIILEDQYGKTHNLQDYKGKVVFINFWATWCGYCVEELPYLERVAKDYPDDVVVLGISGPKSKKAPQNPDVSKEEIIEFLKKKEISYPVLFDETGEYFREYGIKFFPTSFVVARDGYLDGYIPGGVAEESLRKIIDEAIKKGK